MELTLGTAAVLADPYADAVNAAAQRICAVAGSAVAVVCLCLVVLIVTHGAAAAHEYGVGQDRRYILCVCDCLAHTSAVARASPSVRGGDGVV